LLQAKMFNLAHPVSLHSSHDNGSFHFLN